MMDAIQQVENLLSDLRGDAYRKMQNIPPMSTFHDYADIVNTVQRAERRVQKAIDAVRKSSDAVYKAMDDIGKM